jgi:hypothetical protein
MLSYKLYKGPTTFPIPIEIYTYTIWIPIEITMRDDNQLKIALKTDIEEVMSF